MAEVIPIAVEPVAAAANFAETVALSQGDGAAHGVGSPASEAPLGASEGTAAPASAQTPAYAGAELSASKHDRAAHAAGQTVETPSERRLESGRTEAIGQAVEALEPAAVSGEIVASPGAPQAAQHLGSPPAQSEVSEKAWPSEIADKAKPERPKTLFRLWLDLAFGRKR